MLPQPHWLAHAVRSIPGMRECGWHCRAEVHPGNRGRRSHGHGPEEGVVYSGRAHASSAGSPVISTCRPVNAIPYRIELRASPALVVRDPGRRCRCGSVDASGPSADDDTDRCTGNWLRQVLPSRARLSFAAGPTVTPWPMLERGIRLLIQAPGTGDIRRVAAASLECCS